MRELTSHKVNGLNEAITISVLDEPGAGNACHEYGLKFSSDSTIYDQQIHFQNGPIAEEGVNGISQEALLAIVEDRLASFQAGPYACHWNAMALESVRGAMGFLQERTKERVDRGVEGTSTK